MCTAEGSEQLHAAEGMHLKHYMNRNQTDTHSQLNQDILMHLNLEKTLSMTQYDSV